MLKIQVTYFMGMNNMERKERIQKEIYYVRKYVVASFSKKYIKKLYYYIMWQHYKRINEKEFKEK